jgi:hypothetical protein
VLCWAGVVIHVPDGDPIRADHVAELTCLPVRVANAEAARARAVLRR